MFCLSRKLGAVQRELFALPPKTPELNEEKRISTRRQKVKGSLLALEEVTGKRLIVLGRSCLDSLYKALTG